MPNQGFFLNWNPLLFFVFEEISINMDKMDDTRKIRIFISSTFKDMQDEREHLVKKVFPKVSRIAALRDVSLVGIDLRWGITAEDADSGKVVKLCLDEIGRTRPFFIGLIGERYGWTPQAEEMDLGQDNEKYAWVYDDLKYGMSITEIEIQYGVLRFPSEASAHFYIKDCVREPEMEKLKEKIINSSEHIPYSTYSSVEELGASVEADLLMLLDRLYPADGNNPVLTEKRIADMRFNELLRNYVRRDDIEQKIQAGKCGVRCIYGPSGSGKSSFAAYYASKVNRPVIYVPSDTISPDSGLRQVLYFIYNGINGLYRTRFRLDPVIDWSLPYGRILEIWLESIPVDYAKPLILIDQAELLFGKDRDFGWLSETLAKDSFIFIFTDDEYVCHDCVYSEDWQRIDYPDVNFRRKMIESRLADAGKHLASHLVDRIVNSALFSNLKLLDVFAGELVLYGSHDTLAGFVDRFAEIKDEEEFHHSLWKRIFSDFNNEKAVDSVLSVLVSQYGLTDGEVIEITGIRQIEWTQLRAAISGMASSGGFRLCFSDHFVRKSLFSMYDASRIRRIRRNVVSTMSKIVILDNYPGAESYKLGQRERLEVMYQLYELDDTDGLYDELMLPVSFETAYGLQRSMLECYWKKLDAAGFKITDYIAVMEREYGEPVREAASFLLKVANFSHDCSFGNDVQYLLYSRAAEIYEALGPSGECNEYLSYIYNRISILSREHEDKSLYFSRKALEYATDRAGVAAALMNRGIYDDDAAEGELFIREAIEIYEQLAEEKPHAYAGDTGRGYGNLANNLFRRGLFHDAAEISVKALLLLLDACEMARHDCFPSLYLHFFNYTNNPEKDWQTVADCGEKVCHMALSEGNELVAAAALAYAAHGKLCISNKYDHGTYADMLNIFDRVMTKVSGYSADEKYICGKLCLLVEYYTGQTFLMGTNERQLMSLKRLLASSAYLIDHPDIIGDGEWNSALDNNSFARLNLAGKYFFLKDYDAGEKILLEGLKPEHPLFLHHFIYCKKAYGKLSDVFYKSGDKAKTIGYSRMAIRYWLHSCELSFGFGMTDDDSGQLNDFCERIWDSGGKRPDIRGAGLAPRKNVAYVEGNPFVEITVDSSSPLLKRCRLMDKDGNPLTEDIYTVMGNLSCGRIVAARLNPDYRKKGNVWIYGYLDSEGNEVIPFKYDAAMEFHRNRAYVYCNRKWLKIDTDGNVRDTLEKCFLESRMPLRV